MLKKMKNVQSQFLTNTLGNILCEKKNGNIKIHTAKNTHSTGQIQVMQKLS